MKFAIITHVNHSKQSKEFFGYGPYVREMNIWLKYVDEVIIVAPLGNDKPTVIDVAYKHDNITFKKITDFNLINFSNILLSVFKLPVIFWRVFWAMKAADHIHLRCPGNVGLIGCFVQILFPKKRKTAKYAGNWDPKSKQPWTYQLQKWILNNTFLTKNIQVLVYGEWCDQSKNIKSFFTATYSQSEKEAVQKNSLELEAKFVFVGSLVKGKDPMYALRLVHKLIEKNYDAILDFYGEGLESQKLENYIKENKLEKFVSLKGNQNKETLKAAYKNSHFVILPSKSEGWPKALAEGMFWGSVPIATKVSCIPFMLDFGNRGVLLEMTINRDVNQIENLLQSDSIFNKMSLLSANWSANYTVDVFEKEIEMLLNL